MNNKRGSIFNLIMATLYFALCIADFIYDPDLITAGWFLLGSGYALVFIRDNRIAKERQE